MTEEYYWRTDDPTVFVINDREINLITKGADYAEQFGRLTGWLGTYGISGLFSAYEAGVLDEEIEGYNAMANIIGHLLQHGISPQAIVELGAILLNVETEFVEENFDPGWFVDSLFVLFDERPGLKAAFVRVWERFFLAVQSDDGSEESQTSD